MKNILFLTTMYPNDFELYTPVCHYFTKEWRKMGYNVKVIHYKSTFPIYFYWIATLFKKQIARFIGNDNVETKRRVKEIHFIKDDVPVYSIPIFKFFPHGKYMNNTISKQVKRIVEINKSDNFIPDAIIGHVYNPQLEIILKLKKNYPEARTCLVLHESAIAIKKTYNKLYSVYMNDIELWGLRSKILQKEFETIYGKDKKTFICYSGVPEQYISQNIVRDFSNRTNNFIFIGQLIERKYPSQLLHAIKEVFPEKNYHISFVGGGYKEEEILSTAKLLDIIDNVTLIGKTSRDQIIHYLDISDIFIMISRDEVFGLVYLEAMARGCITIGSRNEGIDGVIEHGTNGFLCEAGNSEELSAILKHINSLSKEELIKISQNAIQTAKEMTDYKVAEKYINTVFEQ